MALLLLTACLVHSSAEEPKCDSNGIVGTFSQEKDVMDSLTITPNNFTKNLELTISKIEADPGIQIYMTVEKDTECKDELKRSVFQWLRLKPFF